MLTHKTGMLLKTKQNKKQKNTRSLEGANKQLLPRSGSELLAASLFFSRV